MRCLLFCLFLSLSVQLSAQDDLLRLKNTYNKALQNKASTDSLANLSYRLARAFLSLKDYENTLLFFEKEFQLRKLQPDTGSFILQKSNSYFNVAAFRRQKGDYDIAEKIALEALAYNLRCFGKNASETADAYKQLAEIMLLQKKPVLYKEYLKQAIKIRKNEEAGVGEEYIKLLILEAGGLAELGDYENAEKQLLLSLALLKKSGKKDDQLFARIYNSISAMSEFLDRKVEALNYAKKSLEIRLKEGDSHIGAAMSYSNIGVYYYKLEQYYESLIPLNKSIKIFKDLLGEDNPKTLETMSHLAAAHIALNEFDKARVLLNKILTSRKEESYYLALWHLAEIEEKKGNFKAAILYLQKVEKELMRLYGSIHPKLLDFYLDFAFFYKRINNEKTAKQYFYKSLASNEISDRVSDPIKYMRATAGLLFLDNKVDEKFVNRSISLIALIWRNCNGESDYKIAIKEIRQFYEALISNIYNSFREQKSSENLLISCFESIKSMQLTTALSEFEMLKKAKVPLNQIEKYKDLKHAVIYHEKQWLEAEFDKDNIASVKLRKDFENAEIEFLKLKSELEKSYHFQFYGQIATNDFSNFRKQIPKNELVLHYFLGDSLSFLLTFNQHKFELKKNEKQIFTELSAFLVDLLNVQSVEDNLNASARKFYKSSNLISKAILPQKEFFDGIKKITVIPDALLFYLPFELLFLNNGEKQFDNFHEMPYLIKSFSVRYAYSLQVLNKQRHLDKKCKITAIAPFYSSEGSNLMTLKADEELNNLEEHYRGQFFRNKNINKAQMLKILAENPDILHLAMHASAPDNSNAYFYLSDQEKLDIQEISRFNLDKTAMIVLSACQTALGIQKEGDGLMSLGRAFAYSGASSVVNTLWPLHDHSAIELMKLFYGYLDKGLTKSEALRMAKLDFLNNAAALHTHPIYWAAPVIWGNDAVIQIQKKSSFLWVYIFSIFSFILALSMWIFRKRLIFGLKKLK